MVNLSSVDPAARQRPQVAMWSESPRPLKLKLLSWLPNTWVLTTADRSRRSLYLTFDDGPDPDHTPRLLDLLAAHDAKATFFVIGRQAQAYPEVLRRIVAEGHRLGNHSWAHENFAGISIASQRDEIECTDRVLAQVDGESLHSFRPPRGLLSLRLIMDCRHQRRQIAYWSYDTRDYSRRSIQELVALVRKHPVRAGDIVLLHDDSEHSFGLLEVMLPQWKNEGYVFHTLPSSNVVPEPVLAVESGAVL